MQEDKSRKAISPIAEVLGSSVEGVADAAISIGVAMMAAETMRVLARRGVDAPTFRLVAFGGAGPLLAALLAEEVYIKSVLVPAHPGALSAFGAATADVEGDLIHPVYRRASLLESGDLPGAFEYLRARSHDWFETVAAGVTLVSKKVEWSADIRYDGQGYDVTVPLEEGWLTGSDVSRITEAFHRVHQATYGHFDAGRDIWIKELRAHVTGFVPKPARMEVRHADTPASAPSRRIRIRGEEMEARIWARAALPANGLRGPAIIDQFDTTTLVPPGWQVTVTRDGAMVMTKVE
jgi:N-methylhydantoinase A